MRCGSVHGRIASAWACALASTATGLLAASAPLDLDTAIQTALEHNRRLVFGAFGVERQRLGLKSAQQEFDVEVAPQAAINTTDGDTDWRYGLRAEKKLLWGTEIGLGVEATRYPSFIDDNWRSAITADIRQPLFRNFGRLVQQEGITAAGDRLLTERRRWEIQKGDLVVEVVTAFETIVRLRKQASCDNAILSRADGLRELTRVRERQGRASRVDTLRVELQHGQAEARLESHNEELFSAQRDLAELLGFPPEKELDIVSAPLPDLQVPDMESAVQTALSNRLDYAQALHDHRTAQRLATLAEHRLQPDLNVVAESRRYDQDDRFSRALGFDRDLWTIGLAGQMDLLQHRDKTAVAAAKVDVEAARESIRIKSFSIAREVQQAVSAYRQARAAFTIAGGNYEAAQARAELSRRLFEMGRGDNFAAIDAESAFIDAETSLLASRSLSCVAGYRLLHAMGTLTEAPAALKPQFQESLP